MPAAATAFLDSDGPLHDPFSLGDMAEACVLIEAAIADGRTIVVHGDYDVDGVCATALAVEVLRRLGGEVEPFLPSRFEHGYGVAIASVEEFAAAGAGLLITVDCGIAAPEAVARARELGLAVVVTDHHRPGPVLPMPRSSPPARPQAPATRSPISAAPAWCSSSRRRSGRVATAAIRPRCRPRSTSSPTSSPSPRWPTSLTSTTISTESERGYVLLTKNSASWRYNNWRKNLSLSAIK